MKKVLIAGVAVLVVVGGVGAYALLGNKSEDKKTTSVSDKQATATTEQASIEELLTRNASLKCTFNVKEAESTNTGTAYFAGGKNMYGEFVTTAAGTNTSVNIIRNGDTQYVWVKDSTSGFKTDVSAYDKTKQQQLSQQLDPNRKYQFSCVNWNKDEKLFTPPASVNFVEFNLPQ